MQQAFEHERQRVFDPEQRRGNIYLRDEFLAAKASVRLFTLDWSDPPGASTCLLPCKVMLVHIDLNKRDVLVLFEDRTYVHTNIQSTGNKDGSDLLARVDVLVEILEGRDCLNCWW